MLTKKEQLEKELERAKAYGTRSQIAWLLIEIEQIDEELEEFTPVKEIERGTQVKTIVANEWLPPLTRNAIKFGLECGMKQFVGFKVLGKKDNYLLMQIPDSKKRIKVQIAS